MFIHHYTSICRSWWVIVKTQKCICLMHLCWYKWCKSQKSTCINMLWHIHSYALIRGHCMYGKHPPRYRYLQSSIYSQCWLTDSLSLVLDVLVSNLQRAVCHISIITVPNTMSCVQDAYCFLIFALRYLCAPISPSYAKLTACCLSHIPLLCWHDCHHCSLQDIQDVPCGQFSSV